MRAFPLASPGHPWRLMLPAVALLGWLLAVAPLGVALVATLGAVLGLCLVTWPAAGLALVALAVPFGSLASVRVAGLEVDGADLAVAAAAATWLVGMAIRKEVRLRSDGVVWGALLFLGAMLLSALPARSLPLVAKEAAKWMELVVVYLLARSLAGEKGRRMVVAAVLAGAGLEAALGLAQFATGSGPPGFRLLERFSRAYGTFDQPNPFGGYLAFILPLAAVLGLGRRSLRHTPGLALLALATLVLAAAGIVLSFSRSALLAGAAGLVVVIVLRSRRGAVLFALGASLAPIVAVLGSLRLLPDFITQRLGVALTYVGVVDLSTVPVTEENFAVIERLAHWLAGYRMFADHPFLGVGAGNYPVAYAGYALPGWDDPLGHAHNVYLNVMAEVGLVGLVSFLVFLAWATYTAASLARRGTGLESRLAWGALGGLVALSVFNVFDSLFVHGMTALVGLLLGLPKGSRE